MGIFKFTFDDDNLKEIRVTCKYEGEEEKDHEDLLETIKMFCIDTIPEELNPKVSEIDGEDESGYLIECGDAETGKEILTHIFKYVYLIERMVMIFINEFSKGSEINVESLDFSLLQPDIDKVEGLEYRELANLIKEMDKNYVEN